jgi:hypothetical protein
VGTRTQLQVRFGPASAAVHLDAGWLEHIGGDALGRQQAVQPEAIAPRLETACYRSDTPQLGGGLHPQIGDGLEQHCRVATLHAMQPRLLDARQARRHYPR